MCCVQCEWGGGRGGRTWGKRWRAAGLRAGCRGMPGREATAVATGSQPRTLYYLSSVHLLCIFFCCFRCLWRIAPRALRVSPTVSDTTASTMLQRKATAAAGEQ